MKRSFVIFDIIIAPVIVLLGLALIGLYLAAQKPVDPSETISSLSNVDEYLKKMQMTQT
jgi:hypothetical protein